MTWWNWEHSSRFMRRSRFLKQTVEDLLSGRLKRTAHSAQGMTMPVIIAALEEKREPYVIRAWPGQGYTIELGDPIESTNAKVFASVNAR